MNKYYVVLVINGILKTISGFDYSEYQAAVDVFKQHYRTHIDDPDLDVRFDEIIDTGYIGFGNMGENNIQFWNFTEGSYVQDT